MLTLLSLFATSTMVLADTPRDLQGFPSNGLEILSSFTVGAFENFGLGPDCGAFIGALDLIVGEPVTAENMMSQTLDFTIDGTFAIAPFGPNCSVEFLGDTTTDISLSFTLAAQQFDFTIPTELVTPSFPDCIAGSSSAFPDDGFVQGLCAVLIPELQSLADLVGDAELVGTLGARRPPLNIDQVIALDENNVNTILDNVTGFFEGVNRPTFEDTLETLQISIEIAPVVVGIDENFNAILDAVEGAQVDPVANAANIIAVFTQNIPNLYDFGTGRSFDEDVVPRVNIELALGQVSLLFVNGFIQNPNADDLTAALELAFAALIGEDVANITQNELDVIAFISQITLALIEDNFDDPGTQFQLFSSLNAILNDPQLTTQILTILGASAQFAEDMDIFAFALVIAGLGNDPETVFILQTSLLFLENLVEGTLFSDIQRQVELIDFLDTFTNNTDQSIAILTSLQAFNTLLEDGDIFAFANAIAILGNDPEVVGQLQFTIGFFEQFANSNDMFSFAFNNTATFAAILGTDEGTIFEILIFLSQVQQEGVIFLATNFGEGIDLITALIEGILSLFDFYDDYYYFGNNTVAPTMLPTFFDFPDFGTDSPTFFDFPDFGTFAPTFSDDYDAFFEGIPVVDFIVDLVADVFNFDLGFVQDFFYYEFLVSYTIDYYEGRELNLLLIGLEALLEIPVTAILGDDFFYYDDYNQTEFYDFSSITFGDLTAGFLIDLFDNEFVTGFLSVIDNTTSILDIFIELEDVTFGELQQSFIEANSTDGVDFVATLQDQFVAETGQPEEVFFFLTVTPVLNATAQGLIDLLLDNLDIALQAGVDELKRLDLLSTLREPAIAAILSLFGIETNDLGLVIATVDIPGFGVQDITLLQLEGVPLLNIGAFNENNGAFLLPQVDLTFSNVQIQVLALGQVFTLTSDFSFSAVQGLFLLINYIQLGEFGFGAWDSIPAGFQVFEDLASCALSSVAISLNVRNVLANFMLNFDAVSVSPYAPDLTNGFIEDTIDFLVRLYSPALPTLLEIAPEILFLDVEDVFFIPEGVAVCQANPFVEPPINTGAPTPAPTDGDDGDDDDGGDDEIPVEIVVPAAIGGIALAGAAAYLVFSGGVVAGAAGAGGATAAGAGGVATAGAGGAAAAGGAVGAEKAAADPAAAKAAAAAV